MGWGSRKPPRTPWNIGTAVTSVVGIRCSLWSISLPPVPVKPFRGRYRVTQPDCRIFNCKRCHQEVVICRFCDHGNRYCQPCAPLARAENHCRSEARYQKTEAGRLNHKVRQECYRARLAEKVTDHGDLGAALRENSAVAALESGQDSQHEHPEEPPEPLSIPQRRCDFCGRPCGDVVRTGPVPRHLPLFRRGPRLPGHERVRRRCSSARRRAR